MLQLKEIKKTYRVGEIETKALDGISVSFREKEFVAILGTSGSGKTTCLNIIGGLDRYDSGDLIIKGKSTKRFSDKDWDAYRNNSVGFVFQSYNLIPHLSIVENVEMGMTLSGVAKAEKHKRALEVLERVGLKEHLHKKPTQLSGGQTQRVAIARALANDPEILLCDEPTGALDTATSVQIMDLIKELSHDRLVVMVTHNPDIATKYADRIVRFEDGKIVDDSNPYEDESKENDFRLKKTSMGFFTAMKLSFRNLMTKKGRTFLVSFAGSIGIIGIALILALSNGVNKYITSVEEDTLSSYPLTIEESTVDMSTMISAMMQSKSEKEAEVREEGRIYSQNVLGEMANSMNNGVSENNLTAFKNYLESDESGIDEYVSDIQYGYSTKLNMYRADTENGIVQVNPSPMMELMYGDYASMYSGSMSSNFSSMYSSYDVWSELMGNRELLEKQYDVVYGKMPEAADEAVLIINENNEISDVTLYTLGIKDQAEVTESMKKLMAGEQIDTERTSYTYEEICSNSFRVLTDSDYYKYDEETETWLNMSDDEDYLKDKIDSAMEVKIVGIIRPAEGSNVAAGNGTIGYTSALTNYLVSRVNDSEVVKAQQENEDVDIFTGIRFDADRDDEITMDDITEYISTLPEEQQTMINGSIEQMKAQGMPDSEIIKMFEEKVTVKTTDATYSGNLMLLGVCSLDTPSRINIYPKDFESKDYITDIIEKYNENAEESDKITYTDYIGLLLSSVTTIINAISYILIAFVSISLVVSSIMIGIITYISVLERTKEIGILRALGASKRDISRVFNAETVIIGLVAGCIGIGVTVLLTIPINVIIENLTDIGGLATLPPVAGVILVAISVFLTFLAGIIPAGVASRKDPVIALRTE